MKALATLTLTLLSCAITFAAEKKPLNIIFCFADDWGRYAGAYAPHDTSHAINQVVKTPTIDAIARDGVLFKNAFVNSPSCTPCRSALLSGQYFWRTKRGAILRGAEWDPSIPSYPLLLRDAGYHIGKSYKVWSPGTPADAPYGGQAYAYEKSGGMINSFSQNASRLVKSGMSFEAAKAKILAQVRGNFDSFLAARKPGQPFCYWFGPTHTHRTYEKGSGQALWGIEEKSLQGKLPKFLPDVPEIRADFADYLGEVQALDASIAIILEQLEKSGEAENTLVIVSGDHGVPGIPGGKCNLYDFGTGVALIARGPGIKGGRVIDDFVNLMDLAPTFLEAGGVNVPELMTGRSILGIFQSGKSGQVDPTRTWVVTGRERHVDAAREGYLPYPQRALRTEKFLLIRNFAPDRWPMGSPNLATKAPTVQQVENNTHAIFADMDASPTKAWLYQRRDEAQWKSYYDYAFGKRPGIELYDLKADPAQRHNLAADPQFASVRAELEQQLLSELRRTADPRLIDDGRYFETPPLAGPPEKK